MVSGGGGPGRMRRLAAPLGAVVVLVVAGCNGSSMTEAAGELLPTQEPERATEAFGIVVGLRSESIYVDIPAVVAAVHVTEAQLVERGDVLITLALAEYETLLASRENRLAKERLALRRLEQTLVRDHQRTDTELRRLEIDLEDARAEAARARDEYALAQRVGQKSVQEMEQLRLTAESKERRVGALELSLEVIRTTHGEQAAVLRNIDAPQFNREVLLAPQALGIEIQRKTVAGMEMEIADLRRSASRPHLDGPRVLVDLDRAIVTDLGVRPRDRVSQGRMLLRLIDLDSVVVEAHVAEEFIRDVRLRDSVTIIPLADPSRRSHGSVQRISDMAVYRSGETIVPVFISIDDDQGLLLPNSNVDVVIHHEDSEEP